MAEIKGGETDQRISAILRKYGHAIEKREKDFFLTFFFLGPLAIAGKNRRHVSPVYKPNRLTSASQLHRFISFFFSHFLFYSQSISHCQEKNKQIKRQGKRRPSSIDRSI